MKGEVALGDVKAGAAGFWWCLHIADSDLKQVDPAYASGGVIVESLGAHGDERGGRVGRCESRGCGILVVSAYCRFRSQTGGSCVRVRRCDSRKFGRPR